MQNSSEFQYIAIDTIHESATNPAAPSMRPSCTNLAKASAAMASFSPSPCGPTRKASRSWQERGVPRRTVRGTLFSTGPHRRDQRRAGA